MATKYSGLLQGPLRRRNRRGQVPRGGGVRVKASGDSTVGQEMPINIFICRGVLTPLTGTDNTPGLRDTTQPETCSYTIHRYEQAPPGHGSD